MAIWFNLIFSGYKQAMVNKVTIEDQGGVLFLTQAWVLLNWKSTQLDILIFW